MVCVVMVSGLVFAWGLFGDRATAFILLPSVIPLLVLAGVVFPVRDGVRSSKHFARVCEFGGRVCAGCGYDLRGSAVGEACPECGAATSVELLLEHHGVRRARPGERRLCMFRLADGGEGVRVRDFAFLEGRVVGESAVAGGVVMVCAVALLIGFGVEWTGSVSIAGARVAGWKMYVALAGFAFALSAIGWKALVMRRECRSELTRGARRCPACGEGLPRDVERGFCGGCGAAWTAEGLRQRWGAGGGFEGS